VTAILIVEDEPVLALAIQRILRGHGFEIAGCAGSVSKALTLVEKADFDIALLDVNLRGESVIPVAEALRRRSQPFVFLSGYESGDLPAMFSDVPFFPKPFDAGELVSVLRQLVEVRNGAK
jgi:DNA-binding response OmpR family regulator